MLENNSFEVDKAKMRRTVVYPKSKSELREFGSLVCSSLDQFKRLFGKFGGELQCVSKEFSHCLCAGLEQSKSYFTLVRHDIDSE